MGVDASIFDPNGEDLVDGSDIEWFDGSDATVYLSAQATIAGTYTIEGTHYICYYDGSWELADPPYSWYTAYFAGFTPTIDSVDLGGQPWYGGGTYNISITGSGFSGYPVAFSDTSEFTSSSLAVVSDSLIQGSVTVSPGVDFSTWITIIINQLVVAYVEYVQGPPPPPPPSPTVTIQAEAAKQDSNGNVFVLMGTDQSTTQLGATGSPSGGTYTWSVSPGLAFQGTGTGANVTIIGTIASTSTNDRWVQVAYSVAGRGFNASIGVSVRVPTVMTALNFPGGSAATTVITGTNSGYLTSLTYEVYDQNALGNNNIEVAGIGATEVLQTVTNPQNALFDPPDGTPLTVGTDSQGEVPDRLSATYPGGLPAGFSASRTQDFTLSGYALNPENTQSYGQTYATTSNQKFSH